MPMENRPLTAAEQLKVLSRVWGNDRDGYVFLPWIEGHARDAATRRRSYHESRAFHWPRERSAILEQLEAHDKDDLYFTPCLFNGKKRVSELAHDERTLWADLDPVDPRNLGDRRPTIAWESSPGRYQAIWILNKTKTGSSWPYNENHRLTVEIGADKSGWDTTQLLRVPGRPNYKPDYRKADGSPVPGKLLWLDGPRYQWDDFDDLPEVGQAAGSDELDIDEKTLKSIDRHAVWARVRLKVSKPVREFMATRNADGADRSDVLWQIERDLADAGCNLLEIVAIVRETVWNKYAGRNDELKRLKIEAAKALAEVKGVQGEVLEAADDDKPDGIIWLDDVVAAGIPRPKWLVREIWAKGTCGFISGAPKSYKSWISLDLAVTIATGTTFLGDPQHPVVGGPKPVLMLLEEDDTRLVMARLQQVLEAKAPEMFWHGQMEVGKDGQVFWCPPTQRIPLALHIGKGFTASDEGWQEWLDETMGTGKFAAVIVDTLGTTAGDIDTDRAPEVMSRMLRPLKTLSQKHGCAMMVVHHNKKDDGNSRGGRNMLGSVALHAWVENALYVSTKEVSPRGVTTVKVDRESKQAQDYQFRVRVPLMRTHDDSTRTLWTPELLAGWGEVDAEAHTPEEGETRSQANSGRSSSTRGARRPQWVWEMHQMSPKGVTVEDLTSITGIRKSDIDNAVKRGWVEMKGDRVVLTEKGRS